MARKMTSIAACDCADCAYNKDHSCHAMAITVGGPDDPCPMCDTFLDSARHGGIVDMVAGVGACKVESCAHNESLECAASSIRVATHDGHPDCQTFTAR